MPLKKLIVEPEADSKQTLSNVLWGLSQPFKTEFSGGGYIERKLGEPQGGYFDLHVK